MTNKFNVWFLLIAMSFATVNCKGKTTEEDFLTVGNNKVVFSSVFNSREIPCSSNAAIETKSSDPSWCTASVVNNGKIIVVSVEKNDDIGKDRTAVITVSAGKAKAVEIEVQQGSQAALFEVIGNTDLQFSGVASHQTLMLQTNLSLKISSDQTWCTAEKQGQYLVVNVARNDDESERRAAVTVAAQGFDEVFIKIVQQGSPKVKIIEENGSFRLMIGGKETYIKGINGLLSSDDAVLAANCGYSHSYLN